MTAYVASELSKFFITPSTGSLVDISAYITEINGLPGKRDLSDVTTFGSLGHRFKPSLENAEFTINVLYTEDTNYGTNSTIGYLRTTLSTSAFAYYPAGTTAGYGKISGAMWLDDLSYISKVGDAVRATIHCKVDNGVTIGTV